MDRAPCQHKDCSVAEMSMGPAMFMLFMMPFVMLLLKMVLLKHITFLKEQ